MIVVFEGLDGTGKSTLCRAFAAFLKAEYYPTPPKHFLARRNEIDAHASKERHYRFFKAGVLVATREIRDLVHEGKQVAVDRYWMTTVAYHRAMGVDAQRKDFTDLCDPDATIYTEARDEIRLQRIMTRGLTAGDQRTLSIQESTRVEYEKLLLAHRNVFRVDTSSINQREGLQLVLKALQLA